MSGGYYDLQAILSEEERVPCVFTLDAMGMGVLDPTTSEEDLTKGTKVCQVSSTAMCTVVLQCTACSCVYKIHVF